MAATLIPLAESTTVAKERARRVELRTVVVDARNIGRKSKEGMDGERVNGNRWVSSVGACNLTCLSVPALSDESVKTLDSRFDKGHYKIMYISMTDN